MTPAQRAILKIERIKWSSRPGSDLWKRCVVARNRILDTLTEEEFWQVADERKKIRAVH